MMDYLGRNCLTLNIKRTTPYSCAFWSFLLEFSRLVWTLLSYFHAWTNYCNLCVTSADSYIYRYGEAAILNMQLKGI